jgi:hypothetical protein
VDVIVEIVSIVTNGKAEYAASSFLYDPFENVEGSESCSEN